MKSIGVIARASGATVQALFREIAATERRPTLRVVGVTAEAPDDAEDRTCGAGFLRSLRTGERFTIFQDLGPGSDSCCLAPGGVLEATASVQQDIAAGCDLVVLSKFGKLEAAGGGLYDAFAAAVAARVPILTAVSPAFEAGWTRFASPLFEVLEPERAAIEAWLGRVRADRVP